MDDTVKADEHAPQRLRRKALELIDSLATTASVRDARRRLKELRALAMLLHPKDAAVFHDGARDLGRARDAQAAIEAFDRLRDRFATEWTPRQFAKIRRVLAARVDDATEVRPAIERGRIAAWPVDEMHREDLLRGLTKSYRRARRAMKRALAERTPAAIHEWRKRVKTLLYHWQFLTDVAVVEARGEALRKLSRVLGHHHDLILIDELCEREPEVFGSIEYVKSFRGFIERELAELFTVAEKIGRDLFRERPRNWALQREYARRARTSTSVHLPGFSKTAAVNFPP